MNALVPSFFSFSLIPVSGGSNKVWFPVMPVSREKGGPPVQRSAQCCPLWFREGSGLTDQGLCSSSQFPRIHRPTSHHDLLRKKIGGVATWPSASSSRVPEPFLASLTLTASAISPQPLQALLFKALM